MVTNVKLHTEPYWFNCRECGDSLFFEGDLHRTEEARTIGFCDDCLIEIGSESEPEEIDIMKRIAAEL